MLLVARCSKTDGWKSALVLCRGGAAAPADFSGRCFWRGERWRSYIYWNWTFNLSGLMDGAPLDGDLVSQAFAEQFAGLSPSPFSPGLRSGPAGASARIDVAGEPERAVSALWRDPRDGTSGACFGDVRHCSGEGSVPIACRLAPRLGCGANLRWRGLAIGIGLGWLWTGAASYLHLPLGVGATLGYDEFAEVASEFLNERARKSAIHSSYCRRRIAALSFIR